MRLAQFNSIININVLFMSAHLSANLIAHVVVVVVGEGCRRKIRARRTFDILPHYV